MTSSWPCGRNWLQTAIIDVYAVCYCGNILNAPEHDKAQNETLLVALPVYVSLFY